MSERDTAQKVFDALTLAKAESPQQALPILNGLMPLVQGAGGDGDMEVDDARASAFLRICEVGKALHRGQPVDDLYAAAIAAAERWVAVAK
jgi:hypothetical protein